MKKWYDEEYEFEVEVVGFLRGERTERYCRNGEEVGDRYTCTYGCPVNAQGYGICSKTMMLLYPIMEAVRSGALDEAALDRYEANPNTMDKLDIVAEATGYANLLLRHLEKENQVLFPFAEKNLPPEALARIEQRIRQFEEEAQAAGVQDAHLARLRRLAEKYPA